MTASPASGDLENQFANIVQRHTDLRSNTTLVDRRMRAAIASLREYRSNKVEVCSSKELDYGLVVELLTELEIVVKILD